MLMLRDTQETIAIALLADNVERAAEATSRIRAGKLSALRRLEIYRHNVYSNLRGTLKDIYPVILAVVGDAFFHHAADQFIAVEASRSGDLNQFGGEWATFLGAYPHAAELPYLPDVARLEWAWHEAFHAGDAPPLDLVRLASLPAEEHGGLRFSLHPTACLIRSDFPILRIWEVNQPTFTGDVEVDWDAPSDALLVHRDTVDGVSVLIERLPAAAYAFLHAIAQHVTLEAATAAALAVDDEFELQEFLLESVQSGVIVDCVTR